MNSGHYKPFLSKEVFYNRLFVNVLWGMAIVIASLIIGVLGYHFTEHYTWIDSFLNASMILSGMGPVNPITTLAGKIFASCYAIFSGVVFLSTVAFVFTPVAHRFLHIFHLDDEEK